MPVQQLTRNGTTPTSLSDFGNSALYSYSTAGVIAINTDLLVIDCLGLSSVIVHCTSMGTTGVVTAAWSNDKADYPASATLMTPAGVNAATFNAAGIWSTQVWGRYLRLRLTTATTAGTTTLMVYGTALALGFPVTQPVSGALSIGGASAHSAAASGNPLIMGGVVATAVSVNEVAGDTCQLAMTTGGAQTVKPYAVPEVDWSYASIAGGIVNTSDVAIKAAAGASVRNYLTAISFTNASGVTATEVVVKDGATIIWRGYVGAQTLLNSVVGVTFPNPLRSTANTALNVACITTAAAVYVNAQGYTAP